MRLNLTLVVVLLAAACSPSPPSNGADATALATRLSVGPYGPASRARSPDPPTVISDLTTLRAELGDAAAKAEPEVDFDRQFVLLFHWGGSGRDRLQAIDGHGKVVFVYTRGLTKDLRPHRAAFALPRGTEWEMRDGGTR